MIVFISVKSTSTDNILSIRSLYQSICCEQALNKTAGKVIWMVCPTADRYFASTSFHFLSHLFILVEHFKHIFRVNFAFQNILNNFQFVLLSIRKWTEPNQLDYHSILLNQVIFPRVLPQQKPHYAHELDLLMLMVENVIRLKKWMPSKTVELLETLKTVHIDGKPRSSSVSEFINSLCPGKSFAMFVRAQNCVLIVHMPTHQTSKIKEMQNVIVATFPGNLNPREIYKYDSDVEVIFLPYLIFPQMTSA